MANNIELITNYSPKYWDLVYKQEAVTSVLDANPKLLQFTGAKTVKIGKFQNGGLNDYYRNSANNYGDAAKDGRVPSTGVDFVGASDFGYQKSPARLTWEEFTLKCDRAAAFEIEYFDNEESGDELVGLGVTEISRTTIVPEVDAYCLSTIASYVTSGATAHNDFVSQTSDADKQPLKALNKAFQYFEEHEVPADDQIIYCSPAFMNALRNTNEVTKFLTQEDYNANKDIRFKIEKYEGRTLITVSPDRLRTAIKLGSGGYTWDTNSETINFLAVAKSAVMHVVKYEKVKVISGEANLAARGFDGYTIFARIYHDVFVPDNKRIALYVNTVSESSGEAPAMELDIATTVNKAGKTVAKSITTVPGNVLCFVGTGTESGGSITSSTFAQLHVGDEVVSGTTYYAITSDYKVLAQQTL